jgi:hypothetical protein
MKQFKCLACEFETEDEFELIIHMSRQCPDMNVPCNKNYVKPTKWINLKSWLSEIDYSLFLAAFSGSLLNAMFLSHFDYTTFEIVVEPFLFGVVLYRMIR